MAKLSKYDVIIASQTFTVRAASPDSAANVARIVARQSGITEKRIEAILPAED